MKILFIAPLPPPTTGHSLAAKVLFDNLSTDNQVTLVNLSKQSLKGGADTFHRFIEIWNVLFKIYRYKKDADIIYLTISESIAGNIKDLLIYLLCFRKLPKTVVHLHGGSLKKLLFDKYKVLYNINRYFIRRLGGVVVLGESHTCIFENIIGKERIHTVANFAEENLFVQEDSIRRKFSDTSVLRLLFLSNLITGKGYAELTDAFLMLDKASQSKISIVFAGAFENENEKERFLSKIGQAPQMTYHGIVHGESKIRLLEESHVFCLPTSLFEGQPISILEAYASGCVVIATNMGGIKDVFMHGVNGFEVKVNSVESICATLKKLTTEKVELTNIALYNNSIATQNYRTTIYNRAMRRVMESLLTQKTQ